jgi:Ca-activated chloride channel family protein
MSISNPPPKPHPRKSNLRLGVIVLAACVAGAGARAFASDPAGTPPSGATIIVLDASGSMRERIKGETKMDIAKRAVRELVESLPAETNLGLVVYSHRKANDCADIELMIPPAKVDKQAFIRAVTAIQPKGMTPLSAAVEFAANTLGYTRQRANIILISDGLETCGKDPCATAARLKAAGAGLTVHVVGFDLTAKEAKAIACIANTTGGRFLQANDAVSLKDALHVAVAEAAVAAAAKPAPSEALTKATLTAPATVLAGAVFSVQWTGPDNPGDYVTIVPKGTSDESYGACTYTRQGSPLPMTALLEAGAAELRYVTGRSRTILARAAIQVIAADVKLSAPDEATSGSRVAITWSGPNNEGDYITIVPKATGDGDYALYADAKGGSPLNVAAPMEVGDAEIRYMSGQGRHVLGRRPIKIVPAKVSLDAAGEATAGTSVTVAWTGPNNERDYVTIVPKATEDGAYAHYANTSEGSPLKITVPIESGDAEIRYMSGQGRQVLGRRPIKVIAAGVNLTAVDEAMAGTNVTITWTGPNNPNDYITIVPKAAADGDYLKYEYTRAGSPLKVTMPMEAGDAEIRYVSGEGPKVLARRPIRVAAARVTLMAPDSAAAGAPVEINWTGPNSDGDYITIVPKGLPDDRYAGYEYTRVGSPMKVEAPAETGDSEIRYLSAQINKVLARRPIRIKPEGDSSP